MGGSGSGNRYHWHRRSKKTAVEHCLSLDANRWMREGILARGVIHSGTWHWTYKSGKSCSIDYWVNTCETDFPLVQLSYSWKRDSGEPQSEQYSIHLTMTYPHYGGIRWWFVCPLVIGGQPCKRRVGKLYLPPSARFFGCRHCYDLTYTSCQESDKVFSRLRRILRR